MSNVAARLNSIEKRVMSGLKDFQRATVERIDELYRNGQKRILVSDEVGLGKTLIARGTVAKFAKMRKEDGDDLVKVVYICSNAAIAEQNLNKLRIDKSLKADSTNTSRLSMQHLNIFNQESDQDIKDKYIQFIPLTPDTSFRLTSGAGMVSERALMYAILRRVPELAGYTKELEALMSKGAEKAWKGWCKAEFEKQVTGCNQKSGKKYLKYMVRTVAEELHRKQPDGSSLYDDLKKTCETIRFSYNRSVKDRSVVGRLRTMFAKISIDKLEADIVIMDEFQRFKFLLNADPDSDIGMLTRSFFHSEKVYMLLLSATPYKMYSTLEEIDEVQQDEHYEEFLNVMRFLHVDESSYNGFKTVWDDYAIQLKELSRGNTTILQAKGKAENAMYRTVCRTERISAEESADMIDDHDVKTPLLIRENDVKSYVQAEQLLKQTGATYHVPVDYVKSSPYLMSFMREYQLKRQVEKYYSSHHKEVRKANKDTLWLKWKSINRYDKIPNNNARLDRVMEEVMRHGAEKLLWVPPSRPYYELSGAFKGSEEFTKTLVFSSWEMVPRMLSCMLSYEVERKTVGALVKSGREKAHYFKNNDDKEEKRYPTPRLNFKLKERKANAMSLFCLLYPSEFLSNCYDPIDCVNRGIGLKETEETVRDKIREVLNSLPDPAGGQVDARWYYLLPMHLDSNEYVGKWFESSERLIADDAENAERKRSNRGLKIHLRTLRKEYGKAIENGLKNLGKRPDGLLDVLVDMALASPAVCMNRTYRRYGQDSHQRGFLASEIARVFINRMNTPEATATVELTCRKRPEEAHWMNVLTYSKQGNLQAVFDEYAHLVSSGLDKDEKLVEQMHGIIKESMDIRTTQYSVDTFGNFESRVTGQGKGRPANMRSHFAVAFTKGDGKETDVDRKKVVRNAFNAPFRPFVLASTSIGQEGLDFHNYCRRIVHWNLPSNPIDLEQREGRINRFECLAIRQNIAKRYGDIGFKSDIWTEMFCEAEIREKEKAGGGSDLIPFWGLTKEPDMVKIERIVPMYPLSRDEIAYERLIKILSLYRLTLGQARQEELLEYLFENFNEEDKEKLRELFINLSPYYKRR